MNSPTLQQNEVILFESQPDTKLKKYWYFSSVLSISIFLIILFAPVSIALSVSIFGEAIENIPIVILSAFSIITIIFMITFLICAIVINNSYSNRYYWVTNKRVMYRRGTFGYQISSVPMNRISDVILSRTFLENLIGIESLKIQTLAGQISAGRGGSEIDFSAIPEAEKVQSIILESIKNYQSQSNSV